jgi:hypothetical protein
VITFAKLQCCSLSSNYVWHSYHTCFRKEAVSWHQDRTPSLQHPLIHPESGCLPISLLPNKPASPTKIHPGPICKKMFIANHHISNLWSPNKSFASDTVSCVSPPPQGDLAFTSNNQAFECNGYLIIQRIWCWYCTTS